MAKSARHIRASKWDNSIYTQMVLFNKPFSYTHEKDSIWVKVVEA